MGDRGGGMLSVSVCWGSFVRTGLTCVGSGAVVVLLTDVYVWPGWGGVWADHEHHRQLHRRPALPAPSHLQLE
jgi:hypothetical protein